MLLVSHISKLYKFIKNLIKSKSGKVYPIQQPHDFPDYKARLKAVGVVGGGGGPKEELLTPKPILHTFKRLPLSHSY